MAFLQNNCVSLELFKTLKQHFNERKQNSKAEKQNSLEKFFPRLDNNKTRHEQQRITKWVKQAEKQRPGNVVIEMSNHILLNWAGARGGVGGKLFEL